MPGPSDPVPLYSNLLLHNVMPAGFRGMAEPGAPAGFFRTPPLWGVRHSAPYLHDGRAVGYRQAWQWLEGNCTSSQMRDQTIAATRQLAKRQLTWLRRENACVWYDLQTDGVRTEVFGTLKKFLEA